MIKTFKGAQLYSLRKKSGEDEFTNKVGVAWTYSLNRLHDAPESVSKEMRIPTEPGPAEDRLGKRVEGRPTQP